MISGFMMEVLLLVKIKKFVIVNRIIRFILLVNLLILFIMLNVLMILII